MSPGLMLVWLLAFFQAAQQGTATGESAAETPYVERSEKQFSFYPGGKLQIEAGIRGNVKLIGWDRASVTVDWERIIYRMASEKAKEMAVQYPVRIRWTQTLGTIRTSGPPGAEMEVNLTIHIPKEKTDATIRMVAGDLSLETLNGWIEANLAEGSIEANSINGYFSGTTEQGDINLVLSGKRWLGHSCTAVTKRGFIALSLPAAFSAALQLETRAGDLSIDFPEQLVEGESVPLTAAVHKNSKSLSATVGDGGSPIKLLTRLGDVKLTA